MARNARRGKHYQERTGASPPNPNLCKLIKLGLQISSKSISKHEIVISIERGVISLISSS
ncbi:hypothetical protein HanPI659440_Chr15g0597961 [Helianthus annuus]|nr:hypothetical protein HanPI659440_Chr15g0597961 [Helianthus annuus]